MLTKSYKCPLLIASSLLLPNLPGTALAQCPMTGLDAQIKLDAPGAMHEIRSVSVSRDPATGDRCLLGAPGDDFGAICCLNYGSAYLFEKEGNDWKAHQLKSSNPQQKDRFGSAVAIWGDTAFVGADHAEDSVENSGVVFVFERTPSGWTERQKLLASDPGPHIHFGASVALVSNTAVIGATKGNQVTAAMDAAYVFERVAGVWVQTAKLTGKDQGALDNFAYAVSLSEDAKTILVGAFRHPFPSQKGAVFVFERLQGAWVETAKLTPNDAADLDAFGVSVSVSGKAALIGKVPASTPAASAAYVFEKTGGSWIQAAKLANPLATPDEHFGGSVSIDANTALIGATASGFTGESVRGSAYVFERKDPGSPENPLDDVWVPHADLQFVPEGSAMSQVEFVGAAVSTGKGTHFVSSTSSTVSGYGYLYSIEVLESEALLVVQPPFLSLAAGGKQQMLLSSCPVLIGSSYLLLGSMSGTTPGISLSEGVLPLNFDSYLLWTLTHPNSAILEDSWKSFGFEGEGVAAFHLPPGLPPSLAGIQLQHAFVAFSPETGKIQAISNAASLEFFP